MLPHRTNWTPRQQGADSLPERDGRHKDNCSGQSHRPKQDGCAYQRSFNQNGFHICRCLNVYLFSMN